MANFILLKRFQVAQTYVFSVENSDHCFLFVQKKNHCHDRICRKLMKILIYSLNAINYSYE